MEQILEKCAGCGCEMYHGDKYTKIGNDYYCEDCVDTGELDADNYEPDWDSMPGGYDWG